MNGLRIAVPVIVAIAAGAALTPMALRQAAEAPLAASPPPPAPLAAAPAPAPVPSAVTAPEAIHSESSSVDRATPADAAVDEQAEEVIALLESGADLSEMMEATAAGAPAAEQQLAAYLGGLEPETDGDSTRSLKVGSADQLTLLISASQTTAWLVQHYAQRIAAANSPAADARDADESGRTNDALWLPGGQTWLQVRLDCGDESRLRCTSKADYPVVQALRTGTAPNVWRWDVEALPHETSRGQSRQTISAVIKAGPTETGPFQRIGQMPDQQLLLKIETASWIEQLLKRWTGVLTAVSTFLAALLGVILAIRRFRRKSLEAAETTTPADAPVAPAS